jgi:1,4-dihydroxy-2-naphthoyl-CoA hydrolase
LSAAAPMDIAIPRTLEEWNAAGADYLPGLLGLTFVKVEPQEVVGRLATRKAVGSWNGYLHAGTVVSLADTCCGYGTVRSLPEGASGFTTIELKSNFFGSAREGTIVCVARPLHQGRTTQVWDATVTPEGATKPIAQFRCTQMVLWPKG